MSQTVNMPEGYKLPEAAVVPGGWDVSRLVAVGTEVTPAPTATETNCGCSVAKSSETSMKRPSSEGDRFKIWSAKPSPTMKDH